MRKILNKDYIKEKLIAELRLAIDKYEDSTAWNQFFFTDMIFNILRKPMYKENE